MVYVLNPRSKPVKLQANFDGPFKIIDKSENVYAIQIIRKNKVYSEWLPRDRLRRCHRTNVITNIESDVTGSKYTYEDNNEQFFTDSSSSSDDNDINEGMPHRYDLRPRPRPDIERLQVSFLKLI